MTEQVQKPNFWGQFRPQARHSYRRRPGDMLHLAVTWGVAHMGFGPTLNLSTAVQGSLNCSAQTQSWPKAHMGVAPSDT